jgi:aminopeptidase-like protein
VNSEIEYVLELTRKLCAFPAGVVADGNEELFACIAEEIPLRLHRFRSGDSYNGWVTPDNWHVRKALIRCQGQVIFDGTCNALAVAYYSHSFNGEVDWETLKGHVVVNPELPEAFMFHCQWQYRPWAADWAFSVPYSVFTEWSRTSRYQIDLETVYEPGEMLVGEFHLPGTSGNEFVFNSNSCHPHMANDGFAGTSVMIHLFRWLQEMKGRRHGYRLIIAPEHLGTVFYLRDLPRSELAKLSGGVFGEMMGTEGPFNVASSFTGGRLIDHAVCHAAKYGSTNPVYLPWRRSAGNDETVWEAPGYEVPFVQVNRAQSQFAPFREYHSNFDSPDIMRPDMLMEFVNVFKDTIGILEGNATIIRHFEGLVCLSNPIYDLYFERPDPTIEKKLPFDADQWGYLQDCLPRYFDAKTSVLEIAERYNIPFSRLLAYLRRMEEKGLISLIPWVERRAE